MTYPECKLIQCEQRTPEWFDARRGILTASQFGDWLTKTGKVADKARLTAASKCLAEHAGYPDPPDYCNDLNAMHEAEQSLWDRDWSLRHEFVNHLARILNPVHGYRMQEAIDLLDATARQRAEAFLRTLRKWEEARNNNQ